MTRSTLTNFRAEDFGNESKPDNLPGETVVAEQGREPTIESGSQEVPTGTTREVLDWVGSDDDRAQQAYNREMEDETPRSSLLSKLEKILGDDEEGK